MNIAPVHSISSPEDKSIDWAKLRMTSQSEIVDTSCRFRWSVDDFILGST